MRAISYKYVADMYVQGDPIANVNNCPRIICSDLQGSKTMRAD